MVLQPIATKKWTEKHVHVRFSASAHILETVKERRLTTYPTPYSPNMEGIHPNMEGTYPNMEGIYLYVVTPTTQPPVLCPLVPSYHMLRVLGSVHSVFRRIPGVTYAPHTRDTTKYVYRKPE